MTCETIRDNLSAYIDGELTAREAAAVETHVHDCSACRRELDALRRTADLAQSMPRAETPPDFANDVMVAVRRGDAETRTHWFRLLWAPAVAAAVAFALFIIHPEGGGPAASEQAAPTERADVTVAQAHRAAPREKDAAQPRPLRDAAMDAAEEPAPAAERLAAQPAAEPAFDGADVVALVVRADAPDQTAQTLRTLAARYRRAEPEGERTPAGPKAAAAERRARDIGRAGREALTRKAEAADRTLELAIPPQHLNDFLAALRRLEGAELQPAEAKKLNGFAPGRGGAPAGAEALRYKPTDRTAKDVRLTIRILAREKTE